MSASTPGVCVVIPSWRDATRAIETAHAARALPSSRGETLQIVLVDDGSGDDSATRMGSECGGFATVLALPSNVGRSAARNAGARLARTSRLLFLDSDCRPCSPRFLDAHGASLDTGAVASCGPVEGTGGGFWHHYQAAASARRARLAGTGNAYAGSTQNMMVDRAGFEHVGGFDEAFRHYGFEDRDLLLRLSSSGRLAWTDDARVSHVDALSLPVVLRKMRESGRSSGLFAARHPQAYHALGYAAIDVRAHPGLRSVAAVVEPLLGPVGAMVEKTLESTWLPFAARAALVRTLSGASFLCGTRDAARAGEPG